MDFCIDKLPLKIRSQKHTDKWKVLVADFGECVQGDKSGVWVDSVAYKRDSFEAQQASLFSPVFSVMKYDLVRWLALSLWSCHLLVFAEG